MTANSFRFEYKAVVKGGLIDYEELSCGTRSCPS
jgi:hypothetical protein